MALIFLSPQSSDTSQHTKFKKHKNEAASNGTMTTPSFMKICQQNERV